MSTRSDKTTPDHQKSLLESPPIDGVSHEVYQNVSLGWRHRYTNMGWRGQMIRVTVFSTVLWLFNIVLYVVLYATINTKAGSGVLMQASCSSVQRANTGIHAALNIVISLMLGASNFAMQSLSSPTRDEVDAAHAKQRSLGIGGMSLGNFKHIKKSRLMLWILLWITSLPLHLFFNAVFFTSSKAHQYSVAVVSPNFFRDTAWSPTIANTVPSNFDALGGYMNRASFERYDNATILNLLNDARGSSASLDFARLTQSECMEIYANGFLERASDVVVATDPASQLTSPLVWTRYPERSIDIDRRHTNQDPFNWICHDALQQRSLSEAHKTDRCTLDLIKDITESNSSWTVYGNPVSYCLSRPQQDQCSLYFNAWLMLAVLVCGIVKTGVVLFICIHHTNTRTLRTFGDAVSSFLTHEDPTTKDLCLIQSTTFTKHGLTPQGPQRYTGTRQRWYQCCSPTQFWSTISLTTIYVILLSITLYFAIDGAHGAAFSSPLGQSNIQSLFKVQRDDTGSSGIIPNLLVANIPQLAFSLLYVAYNNLYAKIHMSIEFNEYHSHPMGLRVSGKRRGAQLGSRFFNVPVGWGLTIVGLSAAAHWLTSQALFAVRVDGVDNDGIVDLDDRLVRLGYNCRAIVALIALLAGIALVTACLGWFRSVRVGFGEVGNSLVVSAACHVPGGHGWNGDVNIAEKELSWGDVTVDQDTKGEEVVRHCSFAPVEPRGLVVGAYYR